MIRAILFDLDDTLYEERNYFRSGFSVVARELERCGAGNAQELLCLLEHFYHYEGRAGVFQKLAKRTGFPEGLIPQLISIFRSHRPLISLAEDTIKVLPQLRKHFKLGCVTDGNIEIQRHKLEALCAQDYFDAVVITSELGSAFCKPHPLPFVKCCQMLGVELGEALFVGDSLERDMAGANGAGMRAILIRRNVEQSEVRKCSSQDKFCFHAVRDLFELQRLLDDTMDLRKMD